MSELINNREHRQKALKEVIRELHAGKSVEEVKAKFSKAIEGVSPVEIGQMEVALVKEGLPIEEIQYLCDVHAEVFKGTLEEIHHPDQVPGHPVHTFKKENRAFEELIEENLLVDLEEFKKDDSNTLKLLEDINLLWDIEKHYSRKENLLFPYLEKYGITAPPQVMWGVDDEVRAKLKDIKLELTRYKGNKDEVVEKVEDALHQLKEMIFKEENILFPMALETLSDDEWYNIYKDSYEVGFALIDEVERDWELKRAQAPEDEEEAETIDENIGKLKFETGILSMKELELILNNLPGDFTFVDKNDIVKYFSNSKDRIFVRTKSVIGRSVENCHPPASVHLVDKLVSDFKSGKKDTESFWIKMGDIYALIQYFAIRDENGEYIGTLEHTQDIAPIQEIEGEKRLLSE